MTTTTTTTATTSGFWRTVGWWAFWVAGVLLLLVVVPIKYNWGAVPAAFLAVVVLALASGLWGIGFIGRKTIIAIATIVTIVAFASFFVFQLLASLPKTAKRLPEVVDLVDTKLAAIGTTDTTSPDSSDTTAATPPATASDAFVPAVASNQCAASGEAFLTKGMKVTARLNPKNLHTEGSDPVDYELEGHSSFKFRDDFSGRDDRKFRKFPTGCYVVTTESPEEVHFLWRPKH